MTNHTKTYEETDSGQQGIKDVLRGADSDMDRDMKRLMKDVIGRTSGARHIVEDIMSSMHQIEALDALEKLRDVGFTGGDLVRVDRMFNHNTTELVDSLDDDRKIVDIQKDLEHENGTDWLTYNSQEESFY